jgi:transcriptional regulator with XRE-family HTH domain
MTNNFTLSPALVREIGYLLNGNRHNGWAERAANYLGVSPRTVEAWARGERECEGPPALLMAHMARMVTQGTYLDVSIDEIEQIVESHARKPPIDLALSETRRGIRSVIKLHSSIQKVARDVAVNRSALSRWLSGENALGIDSVSKVLDHVGLNRHADGNYEKTWRVRVDWNSLDEINLDIREAIKLFFPAPPECLLQQIGKPAGRSASIRASLSCRKTTLNIEIDMPIKFAHHEQGLNWLVSTFDWANLMEIYCPLDVKSQLDEVNSLED